MSYQFITSAKLPTRHGEFDIHIFENSEGQEHVMLTVGLAVVDQQTDVMASQPSDDMILNQKNESIAKQVPLIRIHSECLTGDAFSSLKCDCGPQLNGALEQIAAYGGGLLIYLNQEGRGIGLANKIRAYSLQDQGFDTVDANHRLGFEDDERDFKIGAEILTNLGFSEIKLLTNNPRKVGMLEENGIVVTERLPLKVGQTADNTDYLHTKVKRSGHLIE